MNVDLYTPIELMNLFSVGMKKKGYGRIVNTASIAGQIGHPDVWYGIAKAGLINATKIFSNEEICNALGEALSLVNQEDVLMFMKENIKKLKKGNASEVIISEMEL